MKSAHSKEENTTIAFAEEALPDDRRTWSPTNGQDIFRPIHYLGSKLRILDFIQRAIDDIAPSGAGVCDLFAGSGTVSYKLSSTRSVTSVDIQEYSRVICSALLKPTKYPGKVTDFVDECRQSRRKKSLEWAIEPLATYESTCIAKAESGYSEPLCELIEHGSIIGFESEPKPKYSPQLFAALNDALQRLTSAGLLVDSSALTIRHFGGLYFSYLQAAHIDSLLEAVFAQPTPHKDSFLAAILSTASDAVNTVGKQFAQPLRPRNSDGTPKPHIGSKVKRDRALDIFSTFKEWLERYISIDELNPKHRVLRMDFSQALDTLGSDVRIVYADPPYTRDHYSRFYHVLETLSLRDNPLVSKTTVNSENAISRGVYRQDRHQSPFCIKTQAPGAFETLFSKVRNLNAALVLSYSPYSETKKARPRLLTIKKLEELAKKFYQRVEIVSPGFFSHSKLNCSGKNFDASSNAELLMICRTP